LKRNPDERDINSFDDKNPEIRHSVMERCPLCKARLRAQNSCNRCEADLSLLQAIESEAKQQAVRAIHNLLSKNLDAANSLAATACDLHATPFHRALAGFIKTMDGEDCDQQVASDVVQKQQSTTI